MTEGVGVDANEEVVNENAHQVEYLPENLVSAKSDSIITIKKTKISQRIIEFGLIG